MVEIVTDDAGRKLHLRRIGVVEQMRLFKALGPELSANASYMHGALMGAAVEMIDGVPLPFPASEAGLEAALERIGLDAMPVIAKAMGQGSDQELAAAAGN
ncbi:hypothetical protein GCM10010909_22460 [Acidocella aquatica]|uniref:Uncharacterized protein n=1 Tax=Acidocella aquatica TaxID=1922313 RepID=A0ABQ6ABX3_9PROT|nr:hypothetical protein [Acidocella aquatica]GLR67565.1 hypothetical protein GCM10010909_22460 [Acidocella aquatica]